MKNENNTTTWIYRAIGLIVTWLGVSMILSPITTLVDIATDYVDDITACIPGVGCIVDGATLCSQYGDHGDFTQALPHATHLIGGHCKRWVTVVDVRVPTRATKALP